MALTVSNLYARGINLSLLTHKLMYSVSVGPDNNFYAFTLIMLPQKFVRFFLGPLGGTRSNI